MKIKQTGFSIVELLIVIGVGWVLWAIAYPNFKAYEAKGKLRNRTSEENICQNEIVKEIGMCNNAGQCAIVTQSGIKTDAYLPMKDQQSYVCYTVKKYN